MTNTIIGQNSRSVGENIFLICRAIVATRAIRLVQIQARPIITCPATKYFEPWSLWANRQNAHIQAVKAISPAIAIRVSPWARVKASGGISWPVFFELTVIMVNRVEEVAVVATQAVISPTPQIT